jgi:hypothetical protein
MMTTPRLALITIVGTLAYLGLTILGWGEFAAFFEVGSEVNRRHAATAFGREVARCAAEAATEIEHVSAGLYARTFGMLARSHDTAAVQVVKCAQIAMAGLLGINSSGSERVVNPLYYRPISVVALNHCLDARHTRLPYIVKCLGGPECTRLVSLCASRWLPLGMDPRSAAALRSSLD